MVIKFCINQYREISSIQDFMVVQRLRISLSRKGHVSSIPGWETKIPQAKPVHFNYRSERTAMKDFAIRNKTPCTSTKTQHSQINKYFFKKKNRKKISIPVRKSGAVTKRLTHGHRGS